MEKNLFEISKNLREICENIEIDEETGEILNADALAESTENFDAKAEAVALYVKELAAFYNGLKNEADVLRKRAESVSKKVEFFKKYLTECFALANRDRLTTERADVSFRRSESVNIIDETLLPPEFIREKIERTPDKTAIKAFLKNGGEVSGASLEIKTNIQIK